MKFLQIILWDSSRCGTCLVFMADSESELSVSVYMHDEFIRKPRADISPTFYFWYSYLKITKLLFLLVLGTPHFLDMWIMR